RDQRAGQEDPEAQAREAAAAGSQAGAEAADVEGPARSPEGPGRITAMRVLFFTWRSSLRRFVDMAIELDRLGHDVVIAYPSTRRQALPKPLRKASAARLAVYDESSRPELGRAIAVLRQARDY